MFFGRASLPSNYVDFLDAATMPLLLPQPEPQYVFAHWALSGRLSLAGLNAGATSAQQYVTMAAGGAPIPQDLDRMARVADSYPGFVQAVDVWGKNRGDTVKFQRPIFSTGGLTEADRELKPAATISTTGMAAQAEEVPVELKQYHGPYGGSGSSVQPYAIESFDAKFRANRLQLTSVVNLHLKRDYTKWLDTVIRDKFRQSGYTTLASASLTDASSFVAGGGQKFNLEAFFRARQTISDREWVRFPNGRFVGLVPTCFNTHMLEDVDYREMSKFHTDGRNLLYSYIGSVQDMDFYECSTTKQYAAASVVPGDLTGTVATGVTLEEALLVGPGAVGFGTAAPDPENMMGPVVRFADDTNFGTVAKVIWYALHAFQLLDKRGVQRILAQST